MKRFVLINWLIIDTQNKAVEIRFDNEQPDKIFYEDAWYEIYKTGDTIEDLISPGVYVKAEATGLALNGTSITSKRFFKVETIEGDTITDGFTSCKIDDVFEIFTKNNSGSYIRVATKVSKGWKYKNLYHKLLNKTLETVLFNAKVNNYKLACEYLKKYCDKNELDATYNQCENLSKIKTDDDYIKLYNALVIKLHLPPEFIPAGDLSFSLQKEFNTEDND